MFQQISGAFTGFHEHAMRFKGRSKGALGGFKGSQERSRGILGDLWSVPRVYKGFQVRSREFRGRSLSFTTLWRRSRDVPLGFRVVSGAFRGVTGSSESFRSASREFHGISGSS